jgi:hypothetical protein
MNDAAPSAVVLDAQGFSNGTAQRNTDVLTTSGKTGTALSFNETSDYINTNNQFLDLLRSSFTISFWVKLDDGKPAHVTEYDFFGSASYVPYNWLEFWYYYLGGTGNISFFYRANRGIGWGDVVDLPDGPTDWIHFVVMVEQSTAITATSKGYMNGSSIGSAGPASCNMAEYNNPYNVWLGITNFYDTLKEGQFLGGAMDNVMFFNKALTEEEVLYLYNSGNGIEDLPYDAAGDMGEDQIICCM